MSANDANPTGGEEKTRIDSPNIKSSVESEPESEVSEAELRRKAKETVAIDGIPIDEKDIKYHSKNIKEVDTGKLFVKVEGAEERKKAAIRAMEQKQRAEKKRVRDAIHAEKKSAHDKERKTRLEKLANIFWAGKRKIATMIGIVAVIVLAIFVPMIYRDIIKPGLDDAPMCLTKLRKSSRMAIRLVNLMPKLALSSKKPSPKLKTKTKFISLSNTAISSMKSTTTQIKQPKRFSLKIHPNTVISSKLITMQH